MISSFCTDFQECRDAAQPHGPGESGRAVIRAAQSAEQDTVTNA